MNNPANAIQLITPRQTVEIHLPDERVLVGPRNTPVGDFLKQLPEFDNPPVVGAVVNNELRELTYPIELDANVKLVTMADADGARIYRRSLVFLLESAFEDLFPKKSLSVDHSVSSGGFFCHTLDGIPLTNDELNQLNDAMTALVKADLPFERQQTPLAEAIAYFQAQGHQDKVRLLSYRQKGHLMLYRLGTHRDYYHGYMVPSTGYLRCFGLLLMGDGFILRYPRRFAPTQLLPMPSYPKLLLAFRQYGDWLQKLGIECVGALDDAISAGRIGEVILVSEGMHEQQVAHIATQISSRRDQVRLVLIAGPSSSGKTTFSKRLAVQLLVQGLAPFALEVDNYFLDREKTPRDEEGNYDFEALQALNLPLLAEHLQRLVAGEVVQLPRYDFKSGKSEPGDTIQLKPDQIIVLEGIHGLNPELVPSFPSEQAFRIYVSCLTQLNLDKHNRISTTDTRLIRRIVRDARDRGYSAQQTIQRWESVRRGEKRHIFPYQENADIMFNSALVYEVAALKPLVEPLLRQVPYGIPEYMEAKRLLAFLEWFLPVGEVWIPDNSILREFIGGSILKDFKLWHG
jgi:uridine kinase